MESRLSGSNWLMMVRQGAAVSRFPQEGSLTILVGRTPDEARVSKVAEAVRRDPLNLRVWVRETPPVSRCGQICGEMHH